MSAPSRLLAWLWAAVWLRWRLTRVKARRLLAGRPTGDVGLDCHLAPADVPVEGVDYDPAELPAGLVAKLDATQTELLDRGRRRAAPQSRRRARRRRLVSLSTAAVVALGAVGAGATALVTGTTGVPAVDRLLGIYEANLDHQPRSSGQSTSIDWGAEGIATTSYVARDGRICSVLSDGAGDRGAGDVACVEPLSHDLDVARRNGVVMAVNADDQRAIVRGFVSHRVASLTGQGPNGSLEVHLGELWVPDAAGVGPLRPFVALGDVGSFGDERGSSGSDPLELSNPGSYVLEAFAEDGERLPIRP